MAVITRNFTIKNIFLHLFVLCTMLCYHARAQYYLPGQDPASTKWNQIETTHFKIIFPHNFEVKAKLIANYIEKCYPLVTHNLKVKPKKISLVLHNQTVYANAFVGWAPKRMEFYTCPPQDQYAHDWLKQLSLHEYRHVIHYNKMNQGFTKILSILLGEQIIAGVLGVFVPFWFIEGDAVLTETLHSNSGRGRMASFEMPIRAQVLEKGSYSYDKASYGSFRNFVPDHYILGYQLVSQGRKIYGKDIWNDALNNVARKPFLIIPFSSSLKKTTGHTKNRLYKNLTEDLKIQWNAQKSKELYNKYKVVSPSINKDDYTDYTLPSVIVNNFIIAKKSSIDDITHIVLIDSSGKEKKVFTPGRMMENSLSASNNLIAWAEMSYDVRWGNRTYSVINTYDFVQKRKRRLSSKSRFFVPSLSHDAKKIAAVEVKENNQSSIVIMDSRNGEIITRIEGSDRILFMTPSWSVDDKMIVSIVLEDKGKSIALIDVNKKTIRYLIPFTYDELSKPVFFRNFVIYTSNYTGIDNLYAFDTLTQQISRITSAMYGATDASISLDEQKLYYSNYTADGFEIVMIDLIPRYWDPVEGMQNHSIKLHESILPQELGVADNQKVNVHSDYKVRRYRKLWHLFNFHSWAPASINANTYEILPGASLMSQNVLGTTVTSLGYEYSINNKQGNYFIDFEFREWYPVLYSRLEYAYRKKQYYDHFMHEYKDLYYHETYFKAGAYLPLNLTSGKYFRSIQPRIQTSYIFRKIPEKYPISFTNSELRTFDFQLFGYNLHKTGARDLYPKWGQVIEFNFRQDPFRGKKTGFIESAETTFYFPGIMKHHGIRTHIGIQEKTDSLYSFTDIVNYPRGYHFIDNKNHWSILSTYKFPVLYPDLSIGSLIFLKRISAAIFYDFAGIGNFDAFELSKIDLDASLPDLVISIADYLNGISDFATMKYQSIGIELYTDAHYLRFLVPITLGIRSTYIPENTNWDFEFIFSINFDDI
ncbi:TolB family protein [candidate division KSB1 bacterium]